MRSPVGIEATISTVCVSCPFVFRISTEYEWTGKQKPGNCLALRRGTLALLEGRYFSHKRLVMCQHLAASRQNQPACVS